MNLFFPTLIWLKCLFCSILVTKIKEYLTNVEINNAKINFNAIILDFFKGNFHFREDENKTFILIENYKI